MNWYAMSRRALQILVVILSLALLAACFRIYSLSQSSPNTSNTPKVIQNNNGGNVTQKSSANANRPVTTDAASNPSDTSRSDYSSGITTIEYTALPKEAQVVIRMIQNRSEFPHRQDGQTFSNRERILPSQARGYYQEYTVPTPGADNRGARRIVSGQGATGDNATSGEYYYTGDHYRSFARVRME